MPLSPPLWPVACMRSVPALLCASCILSVGPGGTGDTSAYDCRNSYGCSADEVCAETTGGEWSCAADEDGDGFFEGDDWVDGSGDCDDDEPLAYPGNEEACDDIDRNCDGKAFTDECDAIFGPTFRITMVRGASPYDWDDGGPYGIGATDPDFYVEFGQELGDFNPRNCATAVVEESFEATWNESCDFTFEPGDVFKMSFMDDDTVGAKQVAKWTWETTGALHDLLTARRAQTLVDDLNPRTELTYRVEQLAD